MNEELREEARQLRVEADRDEELARERSGDNPLYADHLERRARHKRFLANNRDGGLGADE